MSELDSESGLAINGGPRAIDFEIPDWPGAMPDVEIIVSQTLRDGSWGKYHGRCCDELIGRLAHDFQQTHVSLCCSGTIAVELALRAAGVGPDHEVILAGYDFPGNFRAIEAVGAKPVLVDVVPNGWVMDPEQVERAISPATAAILASHLHGQLADIESLRSIADKKGIVLVEDACQVPGARIGWRPAGSFGHVSTLSFGGSKLLSAGRGGAVLTSNSAFHQRLRVFMDRGNDAFPLSQMQAAALIPQLDRLSERTTARDQAARQMAQVLSELAANKARLCFSVQAAGPLAWYKFPLRLSVAEQIDGSRERWIAALQAEGLPIDAGFRGFTLRGTRRCKKIGELPNSLAAANETMLMHHPVLLLEKAHRAKIVAAIQKVAAAM